MKKYLKYILIIFLAIVFLSREDIQQSYHFSSELDNNTEQILIINPDSNDSNTNKQNQQLTTQQTNLISNFEIDNERQLTDTSSSYPQIIDNLANVFIADNSNKQTNIQKSKPDSLISQNTEKKEDSSTSKKIEKNRVTLGNQYLFDIVEPFGNVSPQIRAQRITRDLNKFAQDYSLESNNILINQVSDEIILLSVENTALITLTKADADVINLTLPELADSYQQKIINAVDKYRNRRSSEQLLINVGIAVGVSLLFLILTKIISLGKKKLLTVVETSERSLLRNIKIQGLKLVSVEQQRKIIAIIIKIIISGIYLLLFFTYLGVIFRIFPQTKQFGDVVFSAFTLAITNLVTSIISYLPNLFIIVITLFVTQYVVRLSNTVFKALKEGSISIIGFYQEWAEPTGRIMTILIYAMALAIVFPYLPGADSPAFQGVSLFLGALVTFGGASAISNVIGGVIVIYTRAYQLGDLVKVGDVTGNVLEKTILSTRIRTPNNQIVTIPNATIVSSNIVNFTATNRELKEPLILNTTITLGYDIPWRKVHQVLVDAAFITEGISNDFQPFVLQTALNDFYVEYELKAYSQLGIAPSLIPSLYSLLHQNIQDKCNEADIEILSPHYRAVRDGSHSTIPMEYLPENYQPPGFKIESQQ